MKVVVSGSTGLIGSALVTFLRAQGLEVSRLVRVREDTEDAVWWDPVAEEIEQTKLEGLDAVVHLAGENIAGRWTADKKRRIRESRLQGTRFLRNTLTQLEKPPQVFVSASAIGYYGDRGDEVLTEESEPGTGFLADLCREWEATTVPATQKGMRVVNPRFGVVLSARGGALAKMLPAFKLGVGGVVGSGRQYWSWIALDDAVGAVHHILKTESLKGPVNVCSPNSVTNREFTQILAEVLGRPAILPMPGLAARLALGEMASALLLASARVQPTKLLNSGYEFRYPDLKSALRHVLKE